MNGAPGRWTIGLVVVVVVVVVVIVDVSYWLAALARPEQSSWRVDEEPELVPAQLGDLRLRGGRRHCARVPLMSLGGACNWPIST